MMTKVVTIVLAVAVGLLEVVCCNAFQNTIPSSSSSPTLMTSSNNVLWLERTNGENRLSTSSWNHLRLFSSRSISSPTTHDDAIDSDDDDAVDSLKISPRPLPSNHKWLMERFNITEEQLRRNLRGYRYNKTERSILEDRANWLQERLNFTDDDMKATIRLYPEILKFKDLGPLLDAVQSRLNLTDTSLSRIIRLHPKLVDMRFDEAIQPKLDYLQSRLDLDNTKLRKLIERAPIILALNFDNNIQPKMDWLQNTLDLTDTQLSKVILRAPTILYTSIRDTLDPNLQFLKERFSATDAELSGLVHRFPPILILNYPRNLEPTMEFCVECLGEQGAIEAIKKYPSILSASLEKRLRPRLTDAYAANITIGTGCMSRMACYSEKMWQASLEYQSRKLDKNLLREKLR